MGLPQAARWKAGSFNEITNLEKHGVFKLIKRFGMESRNPAHNPKVGSELFLNQPGDKRRYQGIAGAVYVFRTSHPLRHPLGGQPACEGHSKPAKAHIGVMKFFFYYLSGSTDF